MGVQPDVVESEFGEGVEAVLVHRGIHRWRLRFRIAIIVPHAMHEVTRSVQNKEWSINHKCSEPKSIRQAIQNCAIW